ncbi:TOBE domain-containing protein [Demequina sp. TTPB684]|uniref:TOBE domain-containing protein n=1 Tax=unclassified Demequina TaxID=2620311 RepID=UPI001CF2BCE9|nr:MULTISPECIES: TOBE domain-containing protein [unclassified Demequina]MCB2412444.1 TOBE domain-containing protein [Demequina sp. TTPB684]UPU88940.1 TOBE domain-containing protein [Demequina sp. TMPB413]
MTQLRISEAAALVGVSDDTLRRWIKSEGIATTTDDAGRATVSGVDLAEYAGRAEPPHDESGVLRSARNRFVGLVTAIKADTVMAQVDIQCGPFRVVSLMSSEAVEELGLEVGSVATAVVKATTVIVETNPPGRR